MKVMVPKKYECIIFHTFMAHRDIQEKGSHEHSEGYDCDDILPALFSLVFPSFPVYVLSASLAPLLSYRQKVDHGYWIEDV